MAGIELVHGQSALEALEVVVRLREFRGIPDVAHREDGTAEDHGDDAKHDDHFEKGEAGATADLGW